MADIIYLFSLHPEEGFPFHIVGDFIILSVILDP